MNTYSKLFTVGAVVASLSATSIVSAQSYAQEHQGPKFDSEQRAAIEQAVDNGDYETFKNLVSEDGRGAKMLEVITADNFGQFKAMQDARQAGDKETAKAIAEELGLPKRGGHGPKGECEEKGEHFRKGGGKGHHGHVEFEREEDEEVPAGQ